MAAFIKSHRVAHRKLTVHRDFEPHRATQKLEFMNTPCNRSKCTDRP